MCLHRPDEQVPDGDPWLAVIKAGISDWGGISPITKDWVNPEVIYFFVKIIKSLQSQMNHVISGYHLKKHLLFMRFCPKPEI